MMQKKIAIIGGGAAALMAADCLSNSCDVHIYEKGKTIGRKFLVAGNGGFNLTNSATEEALFQQYTQDPILINALKAFDSQATMDWLAELGIPTFVGTSGRVFPEKGIKPIEVLQKIKDRLEKRGVQIHCLHEFIGFDEQKKPLIQQVEKTFSLEADAYVFALGGASWTVTGSNSQWKKIFEEQGILVRQFESSNCGLNIDWPEDFVQKFEGKPLKNIHLTVGSKLVKGEVLVTKYGLEGNAIYPIVPAIRNALKTNDQVLLHIDLKPHNTHQHLLAKTKGKRIQTKNYAYEFKLSKLAFALAKMHTTKAVYLSPERFIEAIKGLEIEVKSLRPIEEAISTVGGIAFSELKEDFSLKMMPHVYVIGEMLDWDAPTGGFLLQACFAMGKRLEKSLETL